MEWYDLCKLIIVLTKTLIARSIFVFYGFVAVWRVTVITGNSAYWVLLGSLAPLCIEMLYFVWTKKYTAFKWIVPNVFFFLICVIPSIWILEVKLLKDRLQERENMRNNITTTAATTTTQTSKSQDVFFAFRFTDQQWALALEQILIFALVLAKWIAPKGKLSLDELSQLLLVYISTGVDIVELFASFEDVRIRYTEALVYLILFAWSWSLMQFVFVLTATKVVPVPDDDFDTIVKIVNYFKFVNPTLLQTKAAGWVKVLDEMKKTQEKEQGKPKGLFGKFKKKRYQVDDEDEDEDEDEDDEEERDDEEKEESDAERASIDEVNNVDETEEEKNGHKKSSVHKSAQPSNMLDFMDKLTGIPMFSKKDKEALERMYGGIHVDKGERSSRRSKKTKIQLGQSTTKARKESIVSAVHSDDSDYEFELASEGMPYPYHDHTDRQRKRKQANQDFAIAFQAMMEELSRMSADPNAMMMQPDYYMQDPSTQFQPYPEQVFPPFQPQGFGYEPFKEELLAPGGYRRKEEDVESSESSSSSEGDEGSSDNILFKDLRRRISNTFTCFCLYNEIWGMCLTLFFQDVPFFIVRAVIMFYYRILTRLIILFTFKNILNAFLLLNRIRTIYKTERKSWLKLMAKAAEREEEERREREKDEDEQLEDSSK